jgi:hypothetical protein
VKIGQFATVAESGHELLPRLAGEVTSSEMVPVAPGAKVTEGISLLMVHPVNGEGSTGVALTRNLDAGQSEVSRFRTVTVYVWVRPAGPEGAVGSTATCGFECTHPLTCGVTVNTVEPTTESNVAPMVVVPALRAFASPAESIVATVRSDDVQPT